LLPSVIPQVERVAPDVELLVVHVGFVLTDALAGLLSRERAVTPVGVAQVPEVAALLLGRQLGRHASWHQFSTSTSVTSSKVCHHVLLKHTARSVTAVTLSLRSDMSCQRHSTV